MENVTRHLLQVSEVDDDSKIDIFSSINVSFGFSGISGSNLVEHYVDQVHSNDITPAGRRTTSTDCKNRKVADGVGTNQKWSVGVKTADCLPILISNFDGSYVLAVHAGWRGLARNIISASLEFLERETGEKNDYFVLLGPCISPDCYEVGPEVVLSLKRCWNNISSFDHDWFYKKGRFNRSYVDLSLFACKMFISLGCPAKNIVIYRSCTFSNDKKWYSYRRDKKNSGRNWSWISRV
tara:strand:- start:339 stop:1052 length:714 start_codon:yes stop_codon:yes gene_type:complete